MSKRLAYTFRCPEPMRQSLEQIMIERNIDRTSAIKLALYSFCKFMERGDVKQMNLHQIVHTMEQAQPEQFMSFEDFAGQ